MLKQIRDANTFDAVLFAPNTVPTGVESTFEMATADFNYWQKMANGGKCHLFKNTSDAFDYLEKISQDEYGVVLATGSLYLAGSVLKRFNY